MKDYFYNAPHCTGRLEETDRERAEKVANTWEPLSELPSDYNGNVGGMLAIARQSGKAEVYDPYTDFEAAQAAYAPLYEAIPSALALYRLLCLFPCSVESPGPDGYKVVWQVALKHKTTGESVVFGEWKGGFQVFTTRMSPKELPPKARKDLLALLTLLCGPMCPHPYDGTVAGSVA